MPLPTKRKRCSFGGKEGVWWPLKKVTKKEEEGPSCPDGNGAVCDTVDTGGTSVYPQNQSVAFSLLRENDKNIEKTMYEMSNPVTWDDTLARPIYHRRGTLSRTKSLVVSSEDDESTSSKGSIIMKPSNPDRTKVSAFFPEKHLPIRRRRRTKTFGGRSRRPLSLLLLEGETRPTPSPTDASGDSSINNDEKSSSEGNTSPTNPVVEQEDDPGNEHLNPCTVDSTTVSYIPPTSASPFDFVDDSNRPKVNRRHRLGIMADQSPQRPTATSSMQQAKEYFDHLDASYHLQLEEEGEVMTTSISSSSPPSFPHRYHHNDDRPKRSLIRTTRKIQLSSPGFQLEYSKYAQASRELGVSPLVPKEYSKTRREFFQKNVLFNGFVDS